MMKIYIYISSSIGALRALVLSCYKYRCLSAPVQKGLVYLETTMVARKDAQICSTKIKIAFEILNLD